MKTKKALVVGLVLAAGWGLVTMSDGGRQAEVAAQGPAKESYVNAFLFGESIPKKLQKGGPPGFGIQVSHIEWWLGDPVGKKLRPLNDPKTGRLRVRPVDRTVILKQDNNGLTLLGPDGNDLFLSLQNGPLAKARMHGPGQITTFSCTPDAKAMVFANAAGAICRIALESKDLTVTPITGVNQGEGIHFSPDGSRIAYAKYFRPDSFTPGVHRVYVAAKDFTAEKKLTEYTDGKKLGFGFLPDSRIGVVGPTSILAIDPKTGKTETAAGPWKTPLVFRVFGGFNPDGSTFIYDLGGPYMLRLFAFDVKTKEVRIVKRQYLESFQRLVWVRMPKVQK